MASNGKKKEKKQKAKPGWAYSWAKEIIWNDLCSDNPCFPLDMPAEDVYQQRPEFKSWPFGQFEERLEALREAYQEKKKHSTTDMAALARARAVNPKPTHNKRGEVRWEGSDAERLLKQDIDSKKHMAMFPEELWRSRPQYARDCPTLKVFRDHIYAEVHRRKFIRYRKHKKKKKRKEVLKKREKLKETTEST